MVLALIRTFILYILILFCVRIMGRRQVGELQPSELVITMLISNLASRPIEDSGLPLITGIIPIVSLVCFEVFMSYLLKDSVFLRNRIYGRPQVIIRDGKIDQKVLRALRFSIDDLIEELRLNNVFDFTEVECAIAETTGKISIYKKYEYQEVQNRDIGNKQNKSSCPTFVIVEDGCVCYEGLSLCKKDKKFLDKTLKKEKMELKKVLVMICDKNGKYTIIEKERK